MILSPISATTWARLRADAGRLTAAGIAIVLGTGFAAAVLLANGVLERTAYASVTTGLAGADVVINAGFGPDGESQEIDAADARTVADVDGVAIAAPTSSTYASLVNGARSDLPVVTDLPALPGLRTPVPEEGRLPTGLGEIALSSSVADRLRIGVGEEVTVELYRPTTDAGGEPTAEVVQQPLSVVGVLPGGLASELASSGSGLVTAETLADWNRVQEIPTSPEQLLVVAEDGVSPEDLRDRVSAALPGTTVLTADEQAEETIARFLDGVDVLTAVALGFAALALFVAGFVITNTFSVLVAQRTRQLALLRCVGATRGQVRREVLGQAAVLGLLASLAGVALGTVLASIAAAVVSASQPQLELPGVVWPTPLAVLVPVLAGVLVTVGAAIPPARAATRVAPLAALRPVDGPDLRRRASWLRIVLAVGFLAVGGATLAFGLALSGSGDAYGTLVAAAGAGLTFIGVMIGALFVVPPIVSGAGRLLARLVPGDGGAAVRLAAVNGVRNPRRTTSTAAALLIGVTLVSTVAVGAATTQASLLRLFDQEWPVDVSVGGSGGAEYGTDAPPELAASVLAAASGVAQVVDSEPLRGTRALVSVPGQPEDADLSVQGIDPDRGRVLSSDPLVLEPLADGTVVVPGSIAEEVAIQDGQILLLTREDGGELEVTAAVTDLPGRALVLASDDLQVLDPQAPVTRLWIDLDDALATGDPAEAVAAVDAVRDAVSETGAGAVLVEGAAAERATFQQVIDTLLGVLTGLLAVTVLIAVVGVANTLSLSVVERTRESALLRALGLTRRQLRGTLAAEGVLLAGAGTVLGLALGSFYGWLGAASVLGAVTDGGVLFDLPVGRLLLVVLGAVTAGLLASVLPGRRAARSAPVAALAE